MCDEELVEGSPASDTSNEVVESSAELRLPFGSEFSPRQIDLEWLLGAVVQAAGSREQLVESIRIQFFTQKAPTYSGDRRLVEQRKLAGNVVIGLHNYGVISPSDLELTPLGQRLLGASSTAEMLQEFARHILVHVHGMSVLGAVQNLQHRHEAVNKESLSEELVRMGFSMPRGTTKHLVLLAWLRQAEVLQARYDIDEERLAFLLDTTPDVLTRLDELDQSERLFLRSLDRCAATPNEWVGVSSVVQYAEARYGIAYSQDQLRARLLVPLEQKGWIELERGTRGRGARSGRVRGTEKFESQYVRQLLEEDADSIPADLRSGLNVPLSQILDDLDSNDPNTKGRALELLALRLAILLDLRFRKYRLRSAESGYAEVDVIVEGTQLLFTRWQIQCKNTASVALEDLAKEVGLAVMLNSHAVMMVSTGTFSSSLEIHAQRVNRSTGFQVILIDGKKLEAIVESENVANSLIAELQRQAERALELKAPQIEGEA